VIDEDPRVDEPQHPIERPAVDTEDEPWEAWNDHYFGDGMASTLTEGVPM